MMALEQLPYPVSQTTATSSIGRPRAGRRWHPLALGGLAVFGLLIVLSLAAPLLTPYDPTAQELRARLQPPSWAHPLGTDQLGRDVLSRLLYGGRFALGITTIAVAIAGLLGGLIGLSVGWLGGLADEAAMRLIDLLIALPEIVVGLVLAALLPVGPATLLLALTVTAWTPTARLARALVRDLRPQPYIEAATALGLPQWRIVLRHLLPNLLGPLLAALFLRFGQTLLTVAGLSYLGLGAQPPTVDWGTMLADAMPYMQRAPTLILAPGLTIVGAALSVLLAGQGLMLTFDAQQRGSWDTVRGNVRRAGDV
jgi:ABC-type dipeptide/oligopeptide/nickel transport system permease subunit